MLVHARVGRVGVAHHGHGRRGAVGGHGRRRAAVAAPAVGRVVGVVVLHHLTPLK